MKKQTSQSETNIYDQEVLSYVAFQQPRLSYQRLGDQVIKTSFLRQMEHFYLDQLIRFLSAVNAIHSAVRAFRSHTRCWNERILEAWSAYTYHWSAHKRQKLGEFAMIAVTALALGLYLGAR